MGILYSIFKTDIETTHTIKKEIETRFQDFQHEIDALQGTVIVHVDKDNVTAHFPTDCPLELQNKIKEQIGLL